MSAGPENNSSSDAQGRSRAALVLPLLFWAASATVLLCVVIAGRAGTFEAGEECRLTEAFTPSGFGALDTNDHFRLRVDRETGRGLLVLPGLADKLNRCSSLLAFDSLELPAGYEVSIFRRDPVEGLRATPVQGAWLMPTVYDLGRLFDTPAARATEWGLSIAPIHQSVPGSDRSSHELSFGSIQLAEPSYSAAASALLTEWTAFRPWSGRSINVLDGTGGAEFPWGRPVFILGVSLLPALVLGGAMLRRQPRLLVIGMVLPIVLSWLLADAIWHRNLTMQLEESSLLYDEGEVEPVLAHGSDERLASIARSVRDAVAGTDRPVLIVAPTAFQRARLYYHLLPLRAVQIRYGLSQVSYGRSPEDLEGAYVVVFRGGDVRYEPRQAHLTGGTPLKITVEPVIRREDWVLLRIRAPSDRERGS